MWYPENLRLLKQLIEIPKLRPWIAPLCSTMHQWEEQVLLRAKQKANRESDFVAFNDLLLEFQKKFELFLENLVVSSFNATKPQVQQQLVQGSKPLSLAHYFITLEIDQFVSFKLDLNTLRLITLSATRVQEAAQEGDVRALNQLEALKSYKNPSPTEFVALDGELQALWLDRTYKGLNAFITSLVKKTKPWRKGPYRIFEVEIDAEWRSDLKWERLKSLDLKGQTVLDIGTGNGYHLWHMLKGGAYPYAIEPYELFLSQHSLITTIASYAGYDFDGKQTLQKVEAPFILCSPLGKVQALPAFDTVFCMGVLYHRKDPQVFIDELKSFLAADGRLVLETMIIPSRDEADYSLLIPKDKYAGMANVYSIPTLPLLKKWLEQAGFNKLEVLNQNQTTVEEQRATALSSPISLIDFLDPQDPQLTVEGYPSPLRVIIVASCS